MEHRNVRLAAEIQHAVMELIPYSLDDPKAEGASVTRVSVTPDLKLAKIYVEVRGDRAAKEGALKALARARGFLRRALAMQVSMRKIPDLTFYLDESMENQERVEQLLSQLHSKRDE